MIKLRSINKIYSSINIFPSPPKKKNKLVPQTLLGIPLQYDGPWFAQTALTAVFSLVTWLSHMVNAFLSTL